MTMPTADRAAIRARADDVPDAVRDVRPEYASELARLLLLATEDIVALLADLDAAEAELHLAKSNLRLQVTGTGGGTIRLTDRLGEVEAERDALRAAWQRDIEVAVALRARCEAAETLLREVDDDPHHHLTLALEARITAFLATDTERLKP